jgi:hypothetical protein
VWKKSEEGTEGITVSQSNTVDRFVSELRSVGSSMGNKLSWNIQPLVKRN